MAIRLRLARLGSKKRPVYRIVAAENTAPRDGKFIEVIGTYNPLLPKGNDGRFSVKIDRAEFWMGNGARPSDRVARIFEKLGVPMPASVKPKSLDKLKLVTERKPGKHAPAPAPEPKVEAAPVVAEAVAEVAPVQAEVAPMEATEVAAEIKGTESVEVESSTADDENKA